MDIYLGPLAALATAFCWAMSALFFSYSGRQIGPGAVNLSRLLVAALLMSGTHFFMFGNFLPLQAELYRWGWLTLSSILGLMLGDGSLYQAFVMIGPRLSMLIMALVPIFTTFLGWLILGEQVTGLEFLGIILTVGSVGWVVLEKQPGQTTRRDKQYGLGLLFALGGALGQATGLITAKFGMAGDFSPASATLIRMFVAMVMMWSFVLIQGKGRSVARHWKKRRVMGTLLVGSFLGPFLGIWLSLVAIQLARVGIASTLMSLTPILLIPFSFFILKETVSWRSILGTITALAGVALIFL